MPEPSALRYLLAPQSPQLFLQTWRMGKNDQANAGGDVGELPKSTEWASGEQAQQAEAGRSDKEQARGISTRLSQKSARYGGAAKEAPGCLAAAASMRFQT